MNKAVAIDESTLTSSQKIIFDQITALIDARVTSVLQSYNIEDYMISLTGAAGTGKTFLTTQIAKYLKKKSSQEYRFTVTAPTHKAVSVIAQMLRENKITASCKTIHSFLGIKPFIDYEKGIETFKIDKTQKVKEETSILIVDESSMIGSELFSYIQEAIEGGRVNLVLFIGDPYQLLPVDKSENKIFKLKHQFSLTEVVRQAKDSYIIKIATQLRERIQHQNFIPLKEFFMQNHYDEIQFFNNEKDFIEDFYKNKEWYKEDKIIATHKNKNVDAFNRIIRKKYWEQKNIYNPQTLRKGDMLRFKEAYSVNDITLYHNGQIVEIQSADLKHHQTLNINYWECRVIDAPEQQIFRVVDPDSMKVFNDKLLQIAKIAKRAQRYEKKKKWEIFYAVRNMFADVQYIHASTIHKLQGSTHSVSYVDLFSLPDNQYISDDDKYRLTYVAITRAKDEIKIFMPKINNIQDLKSLDIVKKFDAIDEMLKELNLR